MSFLAGIYYPDSRPVSRAEAEPILESILHEDFAPPTGWSGPGIFFGKAGAPVTEENRSEGQSYLTDSITFDGRVDNRDDVRLRLGDRLHGDFSDSALALAVYQAWGGEGLASLVGDWSLAVWDGSRQCLLLASDYAGIRPLYYWRSESCIRWSTRLKPLIRWAAASEIDEEYVAGFLVLGACANRTPFQGIRSVPPGHYLTVSRQGLEIKAYWRLPIGNLTRYGSEDDYAERLRELFEDAVRCRLRKTSPVLAELSGGLDSSSIVCMAHRLPGETSPLVTLTYARPHSLDRPFYEAVEAWRGTRGVHLEVEGRTCLSEAHAGDSYPAFWGQLHTAIASTARLMGARTLLTGTLGDLVMGNWWDGSAQVSGLLRAGRLKPAFSRAMEWSKSVETPVWGILWQNLLIALSLPAQWSPEWSSGAARRDSSFTPDFVRRMGLADPDRFLTQAWAEAPPERRRHFRSLAETLELRKLQAPERLTHLEHTHPYAHRPLVNYLMSVPAEILCGPGERRRLMRRAFEHFWPAKLRIRGSKDSFGELFYQALRPIAANLLRPGERFQVAERGYIDPADFRNRLGRCIHYLDCNQPQLRLIVVLELWLRQLGGV